MTIKSSISISAFIALLVVAAMMGANHVSARIAFNDSVSVMTAIFFRSAATTLVITLVILSQGISFRTSARHRHILLSIGVLVGIQSYCLYYSVSLLPVALALLAFNTYPLWTAFWSKFIYRQKVDPNILKTMPIILFGLALALDIFGATSELALKDHWQSIGVGISFALVAAAIFGLILVFTQHETLTVDPRVRIAYTLGIVTLLAGSLCNMQGGLTLPITEQGWWGLICLNAFYGSAFTIMFTLLPRLGVVGNSAIMNVEPIFALIFAWVLLEQTISWIQMIGALIVVGSVTKLGLRK